MPKALTSVALQQLSNKDVKIVRTLELDGTDYSDYLMSYEVSFSKDFGSSSALITLLNDGRFSVGGSDALEVGMVVELIEKFEGDSVSYPKFYGIINSRSYEESANQRSVTLTCLDYISTLQFWDIDFDVEADKFHITEETLEPNYLPSPNDSLAQLFNFANDAIADHPSPILTIRAKNGTTDDPAFDGFEILPDVGQVKLGTPLNALDNYDFVAKSYYAYSRGIYVEDILEQILTQPNYYDKYLFDETSASNVITNHLTETFQNVQGVVDDVLTPNLNEEEIIIYAQVDQSGGISEGATSITVDNTDGFPTSGSGEINGDIFTWSGKTSTSLTGIPSSGENSLKAHPNEAWVKYTNTYSVGQVWYHYFSNIQDDIEDSLYTLSGANIQYFDKRFGRIILDSPISILSSVTCSANYSFKTLQATGLELNRYNIKSREVQNRFDAINKLRTDYLAPNYIIRTKGDSKIWASYLVQRPIADFDLDLITSITSLEDSDLYTRVRFFGKNKNPKNLLFEDGVEFVSTGQAFTGTATQSTLTYNREEGDFYVYKSSIASSGRITVDNFIPIVYVNGYPIDNSIHQIAGAPVQVRVRTRTETETSGGKEPETEVRTYYDYDIYLGHTNILPDQTIYFYNEFGEVVYTIAPYSLYNYQNGQHLVGGGVQNDTIESISTASYKIFYSTSDLVIDYDNVEFKVSKSLIANRQDTIVSATFEYETVVSAIAGIGNVIDGRWDTQVQTIFYAEPPSNYPYAILDLGVLRTIQAIDIIPGYFKPDDIRKYDVDMRLTLKYSVDGITYNDISDATTNFTLTTGDSISFEEKDLGVDLEARYLKLDLENVKKVEYTENGVWPVAFTEIAIYGDIVLEANATLIPTTQLTSNVVVESLDSSGLYPTTINVASTYGFEEPDSGETSTAYIGLDMFTYTGLTSTSFLGVEGLSEDHISGERVSQELSGDLTVYDDNSLLEKLSDRLYKDINIDENVLYTQVQLNRLARAWLREFVKNHDKKEVNGIFWCYLSVGDTIDIDDELFFVEAIRSSSGFNYTITIARYLAY